MPSQPVSASDNPPLLVAVGDIHGRADLLARLLGKIESHLFGRRFKVIFLGDYVDRGDDSARVIDMLLSFRDHHPDTVFLKGNHEEAMLDFLGVGEAAEAWLGWGGEETLASYGIDVPFPADSGDLQRALAAALPDAHFSFLMDLKLFHQEAEYIFVHAGLDPDRLLEDQRARDMLWIRDEFFQRGEGRFEGHVIVHGHTPVKKPENLPWRINVDTGAFWSSHLTAVVLGDGTRQFLTT